MKDITIIMQSEEGKRKTFTNALKGTYKRQYDKVCPIPYMRDKQRCVNSVYIDNGIKKKKAEMNGKSKDEWEHLPSYTNIFKDCKTKGSITVIQGEPGFGKSTLCLKLAFDWCNSVKASPLRNVDILIILRLRQFGKTTSVWEAIKLFLVPLSVLSVTDIKAIIESSSSVKIILDGYDEYLENGAEGPIDKFIREQQDQNIDVIVTSRHLPEDLFTESVVFNPTEFNAQAREAYIRKAIVDDDDELKAIKDQLEGNEILTEFCGIPLIFVMFAHVAHEKKYYFRDFMSVTGIFRFLISCFHDHLRNKLSDHNVRNLYRYENDHTALDELAFDGLAQSGHSMAWTKRKVTTALTKDFYDRYVALGILEPEKTAPDSEGARYMMTKVRFYHGIFSEWYAAHYLGFMASKPEITLSSETPIGEKCVDDSTLFLGAIDPSRFQYVYRFACGLRQESEDKIINYLKSIEHVEVAHLCSLENSRKRQHDDTNEKSSKHQRQEEPYCNIL